MARRGRPPRGSEKETPARLLKGVERLVAGELAANAARRGRPPAAAKETDEEVRRSLADIAAMPMGDRLKAAVDLVLENPGLEARLQDIADALGVEPRTLARRVEDWRGVSADYVEPPPDLDNAAVRRREKKCPR